MKHIIKRATLPLLAAMVIAGCAGAPSDKGDAAGPKARVPDTSSPPPAPAPRPSAPAPAPRQTAPEPSVEGMTIYELQERLVKLGFKIGTVDGISGPRTVEAIKKYQTDNKLPVTGNVDTETIRKLRSEKP